MADKFDYDSVAQDALETIAEFGLDMLVTRGKHVSDPVAGTVSRTVTHSQTLPGVILPASEKNLQSLDIRLMQDVTAGTDTRYCILAAKGSSFTPEPSDLVEFFSETWLVIGCTPLNVAGVPLIFNLGLRKP